MDVSKINPDGTTYDCKDAAARAEIATLQAQGAYSTEEVNTGKRWINNKPIYRKVVNFGTLPNNAHKTVPHGISNVENFISVTGWTKNPSDNVNFNLPFVSPGSDYCVSLDISGDNIDVQTARNRTSFTISYVILEYTKTTD